MGEDAEIVVHHLDAALELAPSAPELDTALLTELLADALIAAGEAAMRTDDAEGEIVMEQALESLSAVDQRRFEVLQLLGMAAYAVGDLDGSASMLREVLAHLYVHGHLEQAVSVAFVLASVLWRKGDASATAALLPEAKDRVGCSRESRACQGLGLGSAGHDGEPRMGCHEATSLGVDRDG